MSDGPDPRQGIPDRGRARLQPASASGDEPLPKPHDYLERLLGDSELLLRLQLSGYADDEWQPVAAEFARSGLGVLQAWIATGRVFGQVHAKTGYPLSRPETALDDDAVQTLATDTVVAALQAFLESVLKPNRWDPTKGATLKTFFIGQCMFQFPNAYKKWSRQQRWQARSLPTGVAGDLELGTPPAPAADRELLRREELKNTLALLSTEKARIAFAMQNMGYSHEEIAHELSLADAKAVENMLGYQRRRAHSEAKMRKAQ